MPKTSLDNPFDSDISTHDNAVVLIKSGGRISYVNQAARDQFELEEGKPNLEILARRARPSDVFLGLCTSEGKSKFTIDGRPYEGCSYLVPNKHGNMILLSLTPQQLPSLDTTKIGSATKTIETLSKLNVLMTTNLNIAATLEAIFQSVQQLIPADFAEITLWDADNQLLVPFRFNGYPGRNHRLEETTDRYQPGEGFSGQIAAHLESLLVTDVDSYCQTRPGIDRNLYPFQSYLGVPLQINGELIGTLVLTSRSKNAYNENDLETLSMLCEQAAIAVHNAQIYQVEQRRNEELSSLVDLAKTVSSARDFNELFGQLIQAITPLLNVEIAGFLLFDETQRKLEAINPFIGVPPQFVELYKVHIPTDSPAEKVWGQQEIIVTNMATDDPRIIDLGLDHSARAAGIRVTALIPLTSGGRSMGYMQVANKRDATTFNEDDLRVLEIIALQAAPIIENAKLIQQSVSRALRAEALRRIASLSGSLATIDEIFKYSLVELARIIQADIAGIFLLDENLGELQVHVGSLFGVNLDQIPNISNIKVSDSNFKRSATASKQPYLTGSAKLDKQELPIFASLVDHFEIHSVIDVPLIIRDRGFGEILLCSHQESFFSQSDVQLAVTVAGQLAISFERSQLASQTDIGLRKRVDQLSLLNRLTHQLNSSDNLPHLCQLILEGAVKATGADSGSIKIIKSSENGSKSPEVFLKVGEPEDDTLTLLESIVLENGNPLIIDDFEHPTKGFGRDIWFPPQVGMQSGLVAPIASHEKTIGIINLLANSRSRFDQTSLDATQVLATQAAIAISNLQRYQEQVRRNELLDQRVQSYSNLFEASLKIGNEQSTDRSLENIAQNILSSSPFECVLISTYDHETGSLHPCTGAGIPVNVLDELLERQVPWKDLTGLMQIEYSIGRAFYIPHDRKPYFTQAVQSIILLDKSGRKVVHDPKDFTPQDILIIPLIKADGNPIGLINLAAFSGQQPPDIHVIETLEIFVDQAVWVLELKMRLRTLESQVDKLTVQLDEYSEVGEKLPHLIQENQENEVTIQSLKDSTGRITEGLQIIENIIRQTDRLGVLVAFGMGVKSQMNTDFALIAESGIGGPHLIHTLGDVPEGVNPEALLGQRNPLHQCLSDGKTIIVPDLKEHPTWSQSPLLLSLNTAGFLCIPVTCGSKIDSAVLAICHSIMPNYEKNDKKLIELLSYQSGITINNLKIQAETDHRLMEVNLLLDFSRQLGSLEPTHILRNLVDSALMVAQPAHAGFVTLYDQGEKALIPQSVRGYRSNDAIKEISFHADTLLGKVFSQGEAVCIDDLNFAQHYPLDSDDLLLYNQATGGILPVSCMVLPIQSGENKLGVIVLDNFRESAAFSNEDLALITSLAQQTALTLENARLYQAAENRVTQLQALSNVASTITASLEPDELIESLLYKLEDVVPYETATLWLREENILKIHAARGFENGQDLIGITTTTEDSQLFSEMIETNHPISISDIRSDSRFPEIETERLSWLGVPLVAKGETVGVIALEKKEAGFYSLEHTQVASTFASQAVVSLENANLYQQSLLRALELDQRSQKLALLNSFSNQISSVLDPDYILSTTTRQLMDTLTASTVSLIIWESENAVLRTEIPTRDETPLLNLPDTPIFERLRQTLGVFNTPDVNSEEELVDLSDFFQQRDTISLLILPLVMGDELHGLFLIQNDQPYRYDVEEIDLARIITNQAAVAVQNAISFEATTRLSEELEQRVTERTAQLEQEYLREQSLLRIMRELSASLDLDQVLNQTLIILNETVGSEQSTILLTHPGEGAFYYRASVGYDHPLPPGGQLSSLKLNEGLAGWVVKNQKSVRVGNVKNDDRWIPISEFSFYHNSVIVVPLIVGEDILGVVTLAHSQIDAFSKEDQDLAQAAAMQMAVAINNAELFNLIRDQAEGLGTMLRSQQVEASRSMAILEAVADGVLVTDSNSVITLFNQSAQTILTLDRSEVIGKPLDEFSGLFGNAAQTWMETILNWSKDPSSYEVGETYTGRIKLDNKRVVSIHLALVVLRGEFLGTVSIFRDITHQVEVDRLKSEFVATVSHELRTPMTSIKGYVDILLMGAAGELNQQQYSFLDIVRNNTERLGILVNDLLDVSRIEAGKVELAIQPLDLRLLIDEVVRNQQQISDEEGKPMSFNVDLPVDLPRIPGDEERVRQILDNLVSNAYQYTPSNGQINIHAKVLPDEIQVDVKDNGIGIRSEDHERIFERFYRGENPLVLATSGNGLGLSIVRQLINMHNGRLWLSSKGIPGEGSIFSFTLPIQQPPQANP